VSVVVILARVITVTVFGVAALTKITTPVATRQSLVDFGVPRRLAVPGAVLLPLAELAAAVIVAIPATSWWGALPSLVLLAAFSAAIAVNIGRGRTPECRCFGALIPSPVGPALLMRNLVIAVPVLIVVILG